MRRFIICATATLAVVTLVQAQSAVEVLIDVAASRRPIDPRIYGVAHADPAAIRDLRIPLHRWGGNVSTTYNWQANASNRAADWYFESIADGAAVAGQSADGFITDTKNNGAEALITIPTAGWVAKVGPNREKLASFSIAKYGAQTGNDAQYFPDAGNGVSAGTGRNITGNDPNDANTPSSPAFQRGWVQHLVTRWGSSANGGVRYYALDNEPSIWHTTHRDIYPNGASMDDVFNAAVAYSTQIKAVDAGALVMGPEEWGWSGYFYSGKDMQWAGTNGWNNLPDRTAHGNADFAPWYLSQMRQRDAGAGQRLLDIFSLHYYPQGGEFSNDTSTAMQLRRNRSTRALWDPNYVDETWIGTQVQLVPRMKSWVAANYPGTKIGITEYNWGAEGHINGATTQADILGIFGREGLDLATFWTYPAASTFVYKAFKLYRNYDGQGSAFGDTSVAAVAPNVDTVSVFAAQRGASGALTVMAINKDPSNSPLVNFRLSNFAAQGAAEVWRLNSSNAITRLADVAVSGNVLSATLPAQTVTLFVLTAGQAGPPPPAAPQNLRILGNPSGPASIATTAGTPQSTAINTAFPTGLRATVRDANGTGVAGVAVTFAAPGSGASARFNGATSVVASTDASGVAAAPALTANGTTGSYAVTATAAGVSAAASFSLTNTSGDSGGSGWTNVTPAGVNFSPSGVCSTGAGNYGTVGMAVDPSTPGAAVFAADCQGLWRTTNAGVSWTKIYNSNASAGFNGSQWSMAWAPSGAFAVANNGYGSRGGIWRTTNGGASWTQMVSDDVNDIAMSPDNENHLLAASHGGSNSYYESTNGGASWTNLGPQAPGVWYYGEFLNDNVWIGIGPNGLWRGVKSGGTWTWTNPLVIDGPHGGAQFFRDAVNGWFYVSGSTRAPLRKVYRTSLASAGATWTEVADFGYGSYAPSTLFGTPGRVYAQANFATNGSYPTSPYSAPATGGPWQPGPDTPPSMTNGAHAAAVVCDGTNYVLLTSNTSAGVWRYVTNESCR